MNQGKHAFLAAAEEVCAGNLVPERMVKLVYRLAQLEAGKAYTIVIMPQAGDKEPVWFVQGESKVENVR